mmetsp:Transcript_38896/g.28768  ORF Transcript_38896/g.28768 Transcript_38896/m.28768 type:complete len:80 (-) Transcript_38896:720-959(-)
MIVDGECQVICEKSPLSFQFQKQTGALLFKRDQIGFGQNRGYLSPTIKQFKLGLLVKGQWVGEEVLDFKEKVSPFSVVA